MSATSEELRAAVERATPRLRAISEEASARRPAPGKWAPKHVIGHLIDSAANNHQRFVRARDTDELIFAGYDQDAWIETQGYGDAPWVDLVDLWRSYNLHLARVIEAMPAEVRELPRARHNLHEIAWRVVPEGEPATLDYFMSDYVAHLEHHLEQVFRAPN